MLSILLLDDKSSLANFVKSFRFAGVECETEQDNTSIDGFFSSSSDAYAANFSPKIAGSKLVWNNYEKELFGFIQSMKNENTIPFQQIAVRLYWGCVFCLVVVVVAFESTVMCSNWKKKKFTVSVLLGWEWKLKLTKTHWKPHFLPYQFSKTFFWTGVRSCTVLHRPSKILSKPIVDFNKLRT